MKLSIIIVTYNSERVIKNCLRSIYENIRSIEFEVIIIDNDSKDKTVSIIKKYFPQVALIESKVNLGFAKGVNLGIKESKGEYVLLMNPDMIVLGRAITDSLKYLEKEEKVGILSCQFLYPNYDIQASFGNFPTFLTEFLQAVFLYKLLPFGRYVPYNIFSRRWFSEIQTTDWVSGGFMMMKKKVIDVVGLLDENFFMYLEDIDFCKRASDKGFEIIYYPKAKVIHYHMESAKKDYSEALANEISSLVYYFKKYKKNITYLKFFIYLRLYILIARYFLTSWFKKENKQMLKDHIKALREIRV